jgi:hypothetical protein
MSRTQSILLIVSACYSVGFAIFHLFFWRIFDWRTELGRLTYINRGIVQILNLCLTFVFVLFAFLALAHRSEMISTSLGRALLAGISAFWFLRTVEQVVFFGLKRPASVSFTVIFLAGAFLYASPLFV